MKGKKLTLKFLKGICPPKDSIFLGSAIPALLIKISIFLNRLINFFINGLILLVLIKSNLKKKRLFL